MDLEEFKDCLFNVSEDVDDALNEAVWQSGKAEVSRWLATVLTAWANEAAAFSHPNQSKILWRVASNPLFVGWWLDDDELAFEDRLALLQAAKNVTLAIPNLLPSEEPMETGYFMWWDLLGGGLSDPRLANERFEILKDLLFHPDPRVQVAALHGLGHIDHPDRPALVDEYIRRHPEAKDDPWILECRDGTVM